VWHIERIGRKVKVSWNYWSNLKERKNLEDLGIDMSKILNFILKKNMGISRLDSSDSRQSQVVCCWHSDVPWSSRNFGGIFRLASSE
jgi:hypothetical protein